MLIATGGTRDHAADPSGRRLPSVRRAVVVCPAAAAAGSGADDGGAGAGGCRCGCCATPCGGLLAAAAAAATGGRRRRSRRDDVAGRSVAAAVCRRSRHGSGRGALSLFRRRADRPARAVRAGESAASWSATSALASHRTSRGLRICGCRPPALDDWCAGVPDGRGRRRRRRGRLRGLGVGVDRARPAKRSLRAGFRLRDRSPLSLFGDADAC